MVHMTDAGGNIRINRAPVLTLWAAVVAERLGFDHDAALTLGQAVAGLSAYAKGVSLGIVEPQARDGARAERPAGRQSAHVRSTQPERTFSRHLTTSSRPDSLGHAFPDCL